MMIISGILVFLLMIGIWYGMQGVEIVDIIIEINKFSTPYYILGISFLQTENENVEQLIIGFVFINFNLFFTKNIEA